jgi:hypothetical protein
MAAAREKTNSQAAVESASPTRNYISAMADEMARMALEDGDARLAVLLEQAADVAARPQEPWRPR